MSSDVGLTDINMQHAFISAYKSGGEDFVDFFFFFFFWGGGGGAEKRGKRRGGSE